MMTKRSIRTPEVALQALAVLACFALSAQNAYSYLDPVSTTFILQAVAGFFAAAIAGVRSFRRRVFTFLKTGKFTDPGRARQHASDATAGDARTTVKGSDAS